MRERMCFNGSSESFEENLVINLDCLSKDVLLNVYSQRFVHVCPYLIVILQRRLIPFFDKESVSCFSQCLCFCLIFCFLPMGLVKP